MLEGAYMNRENLKEFLLKCYGYTFRDVDIVMKYFDDAYTEIEELKEQLEQKNKIIEEATLKTKCVKKHDFDRIGRHEILDILNKGVDE